jgi:hypothetical protein
MERARNRRRSEGPELSSNESSTSEFLVQLWQKMFPAELTKVESQEHEADSSGQQLGSFFEN